MHRPLLLNGFMASGKTTVGRRLAELAGRPFEDLDQRLEAQFGQPVARIFAERGEAAFRAAEQAELKSLLSRISGPAPVIALGGGALLQREVRLSALDQAVVVALHVSPADVVARVGSGSSRPLLAGDAARRATELLEARKDCYAEAHACLATQGRSTQDLAAAALSVWRRDPLAVAAGESSYAVEIGHGVALGRLAELTNRASGVLLVSDTNVGRLHAPAVERALAQAHQRLARLDFAAGEQHKHLASVEQVWVEALGAGLDRKCMFIGLGGGVTTDMTGFAAACYLRGVPWLSLPTTLLSMVDASVGGKTGVDLQQAKNAVGAFWQPRGVVCDTEFLGTESERGFRGALAEVVKTALIGDPELFELLEREAERVRDRDPDLTRELVRRSIRVKARIVSVDARESGLRARLNLGHTVGHALEAQAGFERLSHGEAIGLGLVAALSIGVELGYTPRELRLRTQSLLERLGLSTAVEREPLAEAAELIGHDKKRAGSQVSFVVAKALGDVDIVPLELAALRERTRALAAI